MIVELWKKLLLLVICTTLIQIISLPSTPKNIIFVEYLLLNSANEVKTKIVSFGYLFKILFSNIGSNKCIVC